MPKRSRSKYNWPAIKQFYIMGKIDPETGQTISYTYDEIARLFHIQNRFSVGRHAKAENWVEERQIEYVRRKKELAKMLTELKERELPDIQAMRNRVLSSYKG